MRQLDDHHFQGVAEVEAEFAHPTGPSVAPDPAEVFILMRDAHVLAVILPEATEIGTLRAAAWLASRGVIIDGLKPEPLRRLGALLAPDCDAKDVANRLRLSNKETERLVNMKKFAPIFTITDSMKKVQSRIQKLGNVTVGDALIISWAARLADQGKLPATETQTRREALETAFAWQAPALPIGGDDIKALGVPAGPEIGTVLRDVEDWWAEGEFSADRAACLEYAKIRVENKET